jgi:predicted transcriptional regulator
MEELTIYEYQAKHIEDTLRLVSRILDSQKKETSVDRDIIQAHAMIKNVLNKDIDKLVTRF